MVSKAPSSFPPNTAHLATLLYDHCAPAALVYSFTCDTPALPHQHFPDSGSFTCGSQGQCPLFPIIIWLAITQVLQMTLQRSLPLITLCLLFTICAPYRFLIIITYSPDCQPYEGETMFIRLLCLTECQIKSSAQ